MEQQLFVHTLQETAKHTLELFFHITLEEHTKVANNIDFTSALSNDSYYTTGVHITQEKSTGMLFLQIQYSQLWDSVEALLGRITKEDIEQCTGEALNIISGNFRATLEQRSPLGTVRIKGNIPFTVHECIDSVHTIEYSSENIRFLLGYILPSKRHIL